MSEPLSEERIREELASLPGWEYRDGRLKRAFRFKDFKEAMSFIVRAAFVAEEQKHHPEIFNVYNRVELSLTTHDAGDQVTELDVKLARAIQRFSWV